MDTNLTSNDGRDQKRDGAGNMSKETTAGNMAKDTGTSMAKDASGQLHKSVDKAAEAAKPAVDRLATQAHAGIDKVSGALTEVSSQVEDKTRQLSDAYHRFAESGRDYVRNKPVTSLAVALAAGYTISKLIGLRKH